MTNFLLVCWKWQIANGLKLEVNGLKLEVNGLKLEVNVLKLEVNGLKLEVNGLKLEVNGLKVTFQGCTTLRRTEICLWLKLQWCLKIFKVKIGSKSTLKQIKPEKCDLEMIVTYNLRLKNSLRHKFVSKNRLIHICDFCLLLRMCVRI